MKRLTLVLFSLLFTQALAAQNQNKLPKLNIDKSNITVSGISSGGYMAVQLHVALSTVFKGAASVAGGIYWCAEGDSGVAQNKCMKNPGSIKAETAVNKALAESKVGNIEKLENLKTSKVFIFASPKDTKVPPPSGDRLLEFYSKFVPKNQIVLQNQVPAGHSWVTNSYGNNCAFETLPWINNCNYDLAGDILKHFYGQLTQKRTRDGAGVRSQLFQFDQSEFQTQNSALFDYGYVYIPAACANRRAVCKLHVALHGCLQNPTVVQDKFATHSGFNSWAESNNIVVLYPQVSAVPGANPLGCWDWFGYTGKDYANRNGTQIIAIQKMVYRLLGSF